MSIGMTYDQYWHGDAMLPKYYREAEKIRRSRINTDLWMQGRYIYDALCFVSPVLNAFAKNGTKPIEYHNEPYPLNAKEAEEREEKQAKAQMEKMRNMMLQRSAAHKLRLEQEAANNGGDNR